MDTIQIKKKNAKAGRPACGLQHILQTIDAGDRVIYTDMSKDRSVRAACNLVGKHCGHAGRATGRKYSYTTVEITAAGPKFEISCK